jgi:hypothetical protein
LRPPSEATITALAEVITPSLQGDGGTLARVYSNFLYFFGDLPEDSRRKLSVLAGAIRAFSRLRYGRALENLPVHKRHRLCTALADAPVGKLQAGFGGLRSLILIATYSEPALWDRIDYDGPTIDSDVEKPSESGHGS